VALPRCVVPRVTRGDPPGNLRAAGWTHPKEGAGLEAMLHSALGRALAPWRTGLVAVGVVGVGLLVFPVIMMTSPGGPLDPTEATAEYVLGAVLATAGAAPGSTPPAG